MNEAVQLINEVGFPIAAAGGLAFFIWKLINRIILIRNIVWISDPWAFWISL